MNEMRRIGGGVMMYECAIVKKYQTTKKNTDLTAQRQISTNRSGSGTAD
jgi:hypothetical protein